MLSENIIDRDECKMAILKCDVSAYCIMYMNEQNILALGNVWLNQTQINNYI